MDKLDLANMQSWIENHKEALIYSTVAVAAVWGLNHWRMQRQLPPGPRGYPIVGSSAMLDDGLIETMDKLRKEYGDISLVWLGANRYWVVLNSFAVVKEAFVDRGADFMDRTPSRIWRIVHFIDKLFTSPWNRQYQDNRKFCTRALRNSGYNTDHLEKLFHIEWDEVKKTFDANCNQVFNAEQCFTYTAANVIRGVIFDRQLPHGHRDLDTFARMIVEFFTSMMTGETISDMPYWMMCIFSRSNKEKVDKSIVKTEQLTDYLIELIKEHEKTFDRENLRDFADELIAHGMLAEGGYRHVAHICITFMADAVNTTVTMMLYQCMYLIHYPQYQKRMREELSLLQEKSGSEEIQVGQREDAHFTEAFICETFRTVTPIITNVPAEPLEKTKLAGYTIPKHFQIVANIYGIHHDPRIFSEPNKFMPERFLKDGKFQRVDAFFPFGIGRRKCMGEQLVRSEVFYFLANTVARYEVCPEDPTKLPDLEPIDASLARKNQNFNMILKRI